MKPLARIIPRRTIRTLSRRQPTQSHLLYLKRQSNRINSITTSHFDTSRRLFASTSSDMSRVVQKKALSELQALMKAENMAFYVVPSEDAHQSEYIAPQDMRRAFISGFTGSAGMAVVTNIAGEKHGLWTDGRYYTQADYELDGDWALHKTTDAPASAHIASKLGKDQFVGIDPRLVSVDSARSFENAIGSQRIKWHMTNFVDQVWSAKPSPAIRPIEVLSEKFSGASVASKLQFVRNELENAGAEALVLSALDEIAWLFNIRGTGDIEFNPVVFSYAIIEKNSTRIFIDKAKISDQVMQSHFRASNIEVLPYEYFFHQLGALADSGKVIWLDPSTSNWAMYTTAQKGPLLERRSPVVFAKARKNAVELEGMKQCHIRDGAALAEFFSWLTEQVMKPGYNGELTEDSVTHKQLEFRQKQANFRGSSFCTISGAGSNAAIIHYHAPHEGSSPIVREKIYLNDSGAQYLDGTTDVTRTWHFGTPTARERDCFTRVVKGVINLSMAIFPKGTNGYVIDVLARQALWQAGLDYNHGTGHGVGHYLNVHEWPPRISCQERAKDRAQHPLEPGMVTSNEPGYYEAGAFGIRIENLMFVKKAETPNNFDGVQFLGFEQLTMVPIQKSLLDLTLMEKREVQWLNDYHSKVWENVSPLLSGNEKALAWLRSATSPL